MRPSLTRRGLLVAATALILLFSGAALVAWPLVALGFVQLSLLLCAYLLFTPRVAVFRSKRLEFAWWVPAGQQRHGAIRAEREMTLRILLRNRSPLGLPSTVISLVGSATISFTQTQLELDLPGQTEVHHSISATPGATGTWFLQGALVHTCDYLGLFAIHAYFPNRLSFRVFPPLSLPGQKLSLRPRTGTAHERAGPRLLRQRGLGSDLRELRDHSPGDPFKRIAWKATARSGRLIVREFESEILLTHEILLDISPSMRGDMPPGQTRLDCAIRFTGSLAQAALNMGDRVALHTFDFRPYRHVPAGDGGAQLRRILDLLLELHQVVDDDLTDLTDAELYSLVARYLAYQERTEVRLRKPPPFESPAWDELVVGASGEAIDGEALAQAVYSSLARQARKSKGARVARYLANVPAHASASDEHLGLLRLYCRLRGIEVPYRRDLALRGKQQGLADALTRAAASRATRFVVLISDLEGISDPRPVLSALRLCRRRHHSVSVVIPQPTGAATLGPGGSPLITRLEQLYARQATSAIRQSIENLGIPLLPIALTDGIHPLVRSLATRTAAAR